MRNSVGWDAVKGSEVFVGGLPHTVTEATIHEVGYPFLLFSLEMYELRIL